MRHRPLRQGRAPAGPGGRGPPSAVVWSASAAGPFRPPRAACRQPPEPRKPRLRDGPQATSLIPPPAYVSGAAGAPGSATVSGQQAQQIRPQLERLAGRPNRGSVLASKRVMAETWVPERVKTISPTV